MSVFMEVWGMTCFYNNLGVKLWNSNQTSPSFMILNLPLLPKGIKELYLIMSLSFINYIYTLLYLQPVSFLLSPYDYFKKASLYFRRRREHLLHCKACLPSPPGSSLKECPLLSPFITSMSLWTLCFSTPSHISTCLLVNEASEYFSPANISPIWLSDRIWQNWPLPSPDFLALLSSHSILSFLINNSQCIVWTHFLLPSL